MKNLIDSIERVKRSLSGTDGYDPRIRARPLPRYSVDGKRVLIVYLFDGLGDAVLLAPVLKALAEKSPKLPIGVLCLKGAARVFEQIDLPVQAHVIDSALFEAKGKLKNELESKLARRLAAKRYQVAVDLSLRDELDSRRWLDASNAELRLGWMRRNETLEATGLTFGTADTRHETTMHWSKYCALPMETLGVSGPSYPVPFASDKEAQKKALAVWGSGRGPRVVLVPGSRFEHRRWDQDRFVAVGRWAVSDRNASVVVCGSPAESKLVRSIAKSIGAAAYTGKDLAVLIEILRSSHAVVTNDTGPMHFAFLLELPTVSIFKYMSPLVWGPWRNDPKFVTLNARTAEESGSEESAALWTRLVIHHLEGLLNRRRR